MHLHQLIKKPLITEKTMNLVNEGKYTFVVDKKADKKMVKRAVEEFFKVEVKKVWLIKVWGKRKRVGRYKKRIIKKSDWKKAIVLLKEGQKIDLFDQASAKQNKS